MNTPGRLPRRLPRNRWELRVRILQYLSLEETAEPLISQARKNDRAASENDANDLFVPVRDFQ